MNKVTGMKWDEKFGNSVFSFEETKAFTDTGSSCILGPPHMIEYIKSGILYSITETYANGFWQQLFPCSEIDNLPTFWLLFGDHWFEVRPEDYAVQVTASGKCALCIEPLESDEYWILGVAFMRGWYSIHNYETH